jgi:hypothetical protein
VDWVCGSVFGDGIAILFYQMQVRLSWIIRQISMTCKQQATVYSLQMSSTCQKNNKGLLVLESYIDSTSTWPLKQLSFFMDMSDVLLNNCANFPFIIFL